MKKHEKDELRKIEELLRYIRHELARQPNVELPIVPYADNVLRVVREYPIPELHAFVRGMLYGL